MKSAFQVESGLQFWHLFAVQAVGRNDLPGFFMDQRTKPKETNKHVVRVFCFATCYMLDQRGG